MNNNDYTFPNDWMLEMFYSIHADMIDLSYYLSGHGSMEYRIAMQALLALSED